MPLLNRQPSSRQMFYESLDWTQPNCVLAASTGIDSGAICRWRQRLKKPQSEKRNCKRFPQPTLPKTKERLLENTVIDNETGCWNWAGALTKQGYGAIQWGGELSLVHRVSYELHYGPIPEGRFICHRCDNRCCWNPSHLFAGTQLENIQDANSKGRMRRGENHRNAKLTEAQVLEIARSKAGTTVLARKFNIHHMTAHHIKIGKNWSWLTGIKYAAT